MPEQCKNCGAELFTGARFCRFCGKQTGQFLDEELPTQRMRSDPLGPQSTAGTARTTRPDTSPVFVPPVNHYNLPPQPSPVPPPGSRSAWGWIVVFIALGLFGALVMGVLFLARSARRGRFPGPPVAIKAESGEMPLTENGVVFGPETVITRTFKLGTDATVSIRNVSGDITVQGWDQPQAELKVIKRGGTEKDRQSVQIMHSATNNKLTLRTGESRSLGVDVRYELRVPREVSRLQVVSINSGVKLSEITGAFSVEIQNGSIELSNVAGSARTRITNGNTRAVFESVSNGQPLEFRTINGNVDLQFKSDVDLDVNAETTVGAIDLDKDLGLGLEVRFLSQRASGRIGEGGQSLTISTVRGNIRLAK